MQGRLLFVVVSLCGRISPNLSSMVFLLVSSLRFPKALAVALHVGEYSR